MNRRFVQFASTPASLKQIRTAALESIAAQCGQDLPSDTLEIIRELKVTLLSATERAAISPTAQGCSQVIQRLQS